MIVAIGRASSRAEVGAVAHLPEPHHASWPTWAAETVLRTVCGQSIIARTFDRPEATCALCLAVSGEHPGKRGKAYLTQHYRPVPRPTTREDH